MSERPGPLPGSMPDRLPENAPQAADFYPRATARELLRRIRAGSLATLDRNTGHPFASLVNIGTDADGSPVILTSRLSTHTANLEADGRASVLLAETGKGDALTHPRLTVLGRFAAVPREAADEARLRRRFLAHHPKAQLYAGFADFAFWRMQVEAAHLNGGFARAADLTAADVLTDIGDAQDLIDAEESAVDHMNDDHGDALNLYAVKLCGAPSGIWRCTGIDPDGLDLANGPLSARLLFPRRVTDATGLRRMLKELAQQARAG